MIAWEPLLLVIAANGAPLLAARLLGRRGALPVDFGRGPGGVPLFGAHKSWRGLASGVAATALVALPLGLSPLAGAAAGLAAMLGDLLASLLKRRMGVAPGGMALGLDQLPESLLPLLLLREACALTAVEIFATVATFFVFELVASRALYRLRLRRTPY